MVLLMRLHHWMGIQSVTARRCERTESQRTKTHFVCPPFSLPLRYFFFSFYRQLVQVCQEETQSLHTICVGWQEKRIYRWDAFVFSRVKPQTGKEKHKKITGTIWAALLFVVCFFVAVLVMESPQSSRLLNLNTKAERRT